MEQGSGPQTAQLHKAEKVEGRAPDKQNTWKTQKREPKKKLQKGEDWAMVWMLTPLKIHVETSSHYDGATKGGLVVEQVSVRLLASSIMRRQWGDAILPVH